MVYRGEFWLQNCEKSFWARWCCLENVSEARGMQWHHCLTSSQDRSIRSRGVAGSKRLSESPLHHYIIPFCLAFDIHSVIWGGDKVISLVKAHGYGMKLWSLGVNNSCEMLLESDGFSLWSHLVTHALFCKLQWFYFSLGSWHLCPLTELQLCS